MKFDKRNPNSSPPDPLEYDPQTIPAGLRESPHCGLWIWKLNAAETYWTKVPTDKNGNPVDCRAFSMTFPQAVKAQKKISAHGLGFHFSPDNDILGLDLDDCVKDGVIRKKAQKIIDKLNSYWEISVSGTGVHIIGKGSQLINGVDEKIVFHKNRFFTFSGNGQGELKDIGKKVNKRFRKPTTGSSSNPTTTYSDISINDLHEIVSSIRPNLPEPDWFDIIKAIHNKSGGSDAGLRMAIAWSAGDFCSPGGKYPEYDEREVLKKWDRCSLDKDYLVGMPRLKEIAEKYPIEKTRWDWSNFPTTDEEGSTLVASIKKSAYTIKKEQGRKFPESKKIVSPAFAAGENHMVHGGEGAGKTYFLTAVGLSGASGRSLIPGLTVNKKCKVLIFDGEMQPDKLRERKNWLLSQVDMDLKDIKLTTISNIDRQKNGEEPLYLNNEDHRAAILEYVKEGSFDMVLFDNLLCLAPGANLNEGPDYAPIDQLFKSIKALGVCNIFGHHDNKSDEYTGTRNMTADLFERVHIKNIKQNPNTGPHVSVEYKKGRDGNIPPMSFHILHQGDDVSFVDLKKKDKPRLSVRFNETQKLILAHLKPLPMPMKLEAAAEYIAEMKVQRIDNARNSIKKLGLKIGSPLKYMDTKGKITIDPGFNFEKYGIEDITK